MRRVLEWFFVSVLLILTHEPDYVNPGLMDEDPSLFMATMLENIRDSLPFAEGDARSIQYLLYTRSRPEDPHILDPSDRDTFKNTTFRPGYPLTVILHGFGATGDDAFATFTKNALLRHADNNILVVDWGDLAKGTLIAYPLVMRRSKFVAQDIADFIAEGLHKELNVSLSDIHFIALSLGANIASLASRLLREKDGTIGRITALDPTLLFSFDCEGCIGGIRLTDANFIDVIHTNVWAIGVREPMGHVDFYPNGGLIQPGCPSEFNIWKTYDLLHCPHVRAWMFHLESINHPYDFIGWPCEDWNTFKGSRQPGEPCPGSEQTPPVAMGYHTPITTPKGSYYLHTKSASPFGLGFNG